MNTSEQKTPTFEGINAEVIKSIQHSVRLSNTISALTEGVKLGTRVGDNFSIPYETWDKICKAALGEE